MCSCVCVVVVLLGLVWFCDVALCGLRCCVCSCWCLCYFRECCCSLCVCDFVVLLSSFVFLVILCVC